MEIPDPGTLLRQMPLEEILERWPLVNAETLRQFGGIGEDELRSRWEDEISPSVCARLGIPWLSRAPPPRALPPADFSEVVRSRQPQPQRLRPPTMLPGVFHRNGIDNLSFSTVLKL